MATKVPRRDRQRTDGGAAFAASATKALRPASGRIGAYALKYELGSGATSTVYLAQRVDAQSIVQWSTLKVLRPELARRAAAVDGFLEQAHKVAAVRHPYVSQPLDVGSADGTSYIASEFLVAEPFTRIQPLLIGRHAEFCVPYVAELIARAAEGLHAAHNATDKTGTPLALVHRNASPHNLFAVQDGTVRVVDFGCSPAAKVRGASRADDAVKAAYMAPELLKTRGVDRRSDVWSLGVVLWEMLAGRPLFRKSSEVRVVVAVLEETIDVPSRFNPAVPSALDAVVVRALQRDRELRFQSAEELAVDLRAASTLSFGSLSTRALADWINTLFTASLDERRQLVGAKAPTPVQAAPDAQSTRKLTSLTFSGASLDPSETALLSAPTRVYSRMPPHDVSPPAFTLGLISEVDFSPPTIVAGAVAPHAQAQSNAPPRLDLAGVLEPDARKKKSLKAPLRGGTGIVKQVAVGTLALVALLGAGAFAGALWHGRPPEIQGANAALPASPSLVVEPLARTLSPSDAAKAVTAPSDAAAVSQAQPSLGEPLGAPETASPAHSRAVRAPVAKSDKRVRAGSSAAHVAPDSADSARMGEVYVATQAKDVFVSYRGGREIAAPGKLRLPAGTQTVLVRHASSEQRDERTVNVFPGALVMLTVR